MRWLRIWDSVIFFSCVYILFYVAFYHYCIFFFAVCTLNVWMASQSGYDRLIQIVQISEGKKTKMNFAAMFSSVLNAYAHHYFPLNEKHSAFRILLVAYLWSQHNSSIKFNPKYISLCVCALVGSRCMFAHCLAFRNVLERLKIHHTKFMLVTILQFNGWLILAFYRVCHFCL